MLGIKLLEEWNYEMNKDSIGAAVFQAFEFYYIRTMGEKLDKTNYNKLEWTSHYMFDSFCFKNI